MATQKELTTEIGASGVYMFAGSISGEEYNSDLRGRRGLDIYDQMRRNDATVKASLRAVKLPVLSAEYRVDPATNEDADVEAAAFVEDCLFHIVDWKKFLGEALTSLDFGFSVFEMVFEPRYVNGKLRLALVKLGYRKQTTIDAWLTVDKKPGITQRLATGQTFSIPLEKIIHIANEQEGDNYEGVSILRTSYKHWKIKDKLYVIDAVGAENQALGIADITKPKGATEKDTKMMKQWARNRRANEVSYIMKPEGWTVEMMDMKAGTLKDIKPSIDHHDRQIMKNVLAQFLEIGSSGSSGTRSTSEDQSRLFEMAVRQVADNIINAVQHTAVRLLIDLNYTNVEYPSLAVGNISDENIPVVTEAIGKLVEAGILHPQSVDENVVRKLVSLPEIDPEELDKLYAEGTEPADDTDAAVKAARRLEASIAKGLYGSASKAA